MGLSAPFPAQKSSKQAGTTFSLLMSMLLSFQKLLLSLEKSFDRYFKKRQHLLHPDI